MKIERQRSAFDKVVGAQNCAVCTNKQYSVLLLGEAFYFFVFWAGVLLEVFNSFLTVCFTKYLVEAK